MNKDILAFIEVRDGIISSVSYELLGSAKALAKEANCKVTAGLVYSDVKPLIADLSKYNIDNIVAVEDSSLNHYINDNYVSAFTSIINEVDPNVILVGATSIGRDLAPRISARLHTGLTADCTNLEIKEDGSLYMTRPAFGGNLIATIICPNNRPQMSTVRPGVMPKVGLNEGTEVTSKIINYVPVKSRITLVEEVKSEKAAAALDCSNLLVSVGRGVATDDLRKTAEGIAKDLGGTVSCTRPLVDAGVYDHDLQVGQTGTTVKPDVYIALGISGAIQHIVGMENSNCIIAINKDKTAPIFTVSDLGIVGDVSKILPLLKESIAKEQ